MLKDQNHGNHIFEAYSGIRASNVRRMFFKAPSELKASNQGHLPTMQGELTLWKPKIRTSGHPLAAPCLEGAGHCTALRSFRPPRRISGSSDWHDRAREIVDVCRLRCSLTMLIGLRSSHPSLFGWRIYRWVGRGGYCSKDTEVEN